MKKIIFICIRISLLAFKLAVYLECFILNHFTQTKGDGLFFRLWLRGNRVKFGKGIYSYYPFYLFAMGNFEIGNYCSFGEFSRFWNFEKIIIGNDFIAAEGLTILTGGHDPDTLKGTTGKVIIGERVWCGANVTILPGVSIGDDCVIAAGSVVIKDVEKETIVAGVPAKVIRKIDMGKRKNEFYSRRKLYEV